MFCQALGQGVGRVELSCHYDGPPLLLPVLEADRKEDLIMNFKDSYNNNGLYDLGGQVPFLSRLAEHYENVGTSSGNDWVNLVKVRVISPYLTNHSVGLLL